MGCELALYDLSIGINGYTGEQMNNRLVGYPPLIYALIRMRFVDIAHAIFPESFANDVRDIIEKMKSSSKKINITNGKIVAIGWLYVFDYW